MTGSAVRRMFMALRVLQQAQKRARPEDLALIAFFKESLDGYDVLRLRAFLAVDDGEFDFLTFGEALEAVALDCTEMCENVRAILLLDEAEAL